MADVDLADLVSLAPLAGPAGRTFRGEVAGELVVVRVYPPGEREPAAPEIDAAVLHLVRGLLPVAEVVDVVRGNPATARPGLLVTSWVDGIRGDLPTRDPYGAGLAAGGVAAALAAMPTMRRGRFVDPALAPAGPVDPADHVGDDLATWIGRRLASSAAWAPSMDRLLAAADGAQRRLDAVARACLVHGDLQPDNLLVEPGGARIAAVVDWERAHAGHPATDLGRLLRDERGTPYGEGVLDAYLDRHPADRAETLLLACSADLGALVDLAARAETDPESGRAGALLREIAAAGDVAGHPRRG